MSTILLIQLALAAAFLVGCGSSSPSVAEVTSDSVTPGALDATPTPRSFTESGRPIHNAAAGVSIEGIIDSCTWEPRASGGPVELNLSFSVVNKTKEEVTTTFRIQDGSGAMYRPAGRGNEIGLEAGATDSRTIHTGKFPVGAEDVDLIISAMISGGQLRRVKEVIPLDGCTPP